MNDPPTAKLNIRYLGFESAPEGGRRLAFSITTQGASPTRVAFDVSAAAFIGAERISFQESAAVCTEKLRHLLEFSPQLLQPLLQLTDDDVRQFRPRKRGAAAKP